MDNSDQPRYPPLVRWPQQKFVASLVAFALVGMVGYWFYEQGHRGGLIEIDSFPPVSAQYMVDINTADWPQIAQLPGVGKTLARRIVDSRESGGPFTSHQDLGRVFGIGPKTISAISPYLLSLPDPDATADR